MGLLETPLTFRYNNPGAIEFKPWMEKYGATMGPNGRYAQFDSPDAGYGVMGKVLDTYQNKHGLNTVSGIIGRWAPSNVDNNSTGPYADSVARKLGVNPDEPLQPQHRLPLMQAMASYEAGKPAPMPGGMSGATAPTASGAPPMGLLNDSSGQPAPQAEPNVFDRLGAQFKHPLMLMGMGVMSGKTVGEGLMQGVNATQQVRKADFDYWKAKREMDAQAQREAYLNSISPTDPKYKGVAPGLLSLAKADPVNGPGYIANAYLKNQDQDGAMQRLQRELEIKSAQNRQDMQERINILNRFSGQPEAGTPKPPPQRMRWVPSGGAQPAPMAPQQDNPYLAPSRSSVPIWNGLLGAR